MTEQERARAFLREVWPKNTSPLPLATANLIADIMVAYATQYQAANDVQDMFDEETD